MSPAQAPQDLPAHLLARPDFITACAAHDFAEIFRLIQKYTGTTNTRIAHLTELNPSRIGEIRNHRRQVRTTEVITRISDGLHIPGSLLGLDRRPWESETQSPAASTPNPSAAKAAGSRLGETSRRASGPTMGRTMPGQVTAADIQAIKEITQSISLLDNKFGGGHVHMMTVQYLDLHVKPMLSDGRYTDQIGRELYQSAAHLGHLAAWTAYDTPTVDNAPRLFRQALDLAVAADDMAFPGEILAALSHHAIHEEQPGEALQLAQASQAIGKKTAVPALYAEACVLEANARALLGEANACASSLDRAESAFDQANAANTPPWLGYIDSGYMAARFAHTLRDVGDIPSARTFAEQASTMNSDLRRTRALNLNLLASTYVESDPEQACDLAGDVLHESADLRSGRIVNYLADLRKDLVRAHPLNTKVREFVEQSHEMLGI
jgi:hypothetical protein